MTTQETLLKLKTELENSINGTNVAKATAIRLGNYQAAADFENQNVGILYAIALIKQELSNLEGE